MSFCQARLFPPLIGQIVAETSIDLPEDYHRAIYEEYISHRKCLIDRLNKKPAVYTSIAMDAFYTVAQLLLDDTYVLCLISE